MARQPPAAFGQQRDTPLSVLKHAALPPLQQFWVAPKPPQTLPSATQLSAFTQRRKPAASGAPQLPVQQSRLFVHTSLFTAHPLIGAQIGGNGPPPRHNVSQHEVMPLQGSLSVTHWFVASQRPALQAPLQQSDPVVHKSRLARQNAWKSQRPPWQTPEQHDESPLHVSPRVLQVAVGFGFVQTPPTQLPSQQFVEFTHDAPWALHWVAVLQLWFPESQSSEQQSAACVQAVPSG